MMGDRKVGIEEWRLQINRPGLIVGWEGWRERVVDITDKQRGGEDGKRIRGGDMVKDSW